MVSVFDIIRQRNQGIKGKGFFSPAVKAESQLARKSIFDIIASRQKANPQSKFGSIGIKKTGKTQPNVSVTDRNVELAQRSRVAQTQSASSFAFASSKSRIASLV